METDSKLRDGGNDFGHELLIANKYGDEVSRTGWNSRRTRVGRAIAKADEGKIRFLSSAIPKCP